MRNTVGPRPKATSTAIACLALAAVLLPAAGAQGAPEGAFSAASMNGVYAFVAGLSAGADGADPDSAVWLVVRYNGDGTADILTVGSNDPGEADEEGSPTREASVARPDPSPSVNYEVSPDGTLLVVNTAGDVLWDGLILRAVMVDGTPVATEYILFHRQAAPGTGGLQVGRGFLQTAR